MLFREVQVNLAYRWYLGCNIDEELSDHSIMTKSRYRFKRKVFSGLSEKIINLYKEEGLISSNYHFMDSTIFRVNVSKESFQSKLLVEGKYLEGLD